MNKTKELIEFYQKKLDELNHLIHNPENSDKTHIQLRSKIAEYSYFIDELKLLDNNINYLVGSATNIEHIKKDTNNKNIIIAHICNNKQLWGAGFVLAISKLSPVPEKEYRSLGKNKLVLGHTQFCVIGNNILVANMIAQDDVKPNQMDVPMVRYGATKICLNTTFKMAKSINATVVMPEIGCGLGGGDWNIMEATIESAMKESDFNDVFVYKFKQ